MINIPESQNSHTGLVSSRLHKRLLSENIGFELVTRESRHRSAIESYIAEQFYKEHGARLLHFMPQLLAMKGENGFCGAVGIRNAKHAPLFLEQYLDKAVEQEISSIFQLQIQRDDVVEIGNLVDTLRGGSYLLFVVLASILYEAGYRWVVCTATRHVEHLLHKMEFESHVLCEAKPEKLQESADDWGSYYTHKPRVLVGDIRTSWQAMQKSALLKAMIVPYQHTVREIASQLSELPRESST